MKVEEFYLSILNNLQEGIYFVDTERKIQFWNHGAENLAGYKAEEMIGKPCQFSRLNHINKEGMPLCNVECPLYKTLVDGKQREDRVWLRHKKGYRVPVDVKVLPVFEKEAIVGAVEVFTTPSEVTYEDNLITELSNAAIYDLLTKLPNRSYTKNYLEYKFDEFKKFKHNFALMYLDIDNFSVLNNTYGHEVGDEALINMTASLRNNVRKSDFIGRWGGEEFLGVFAIDNLEVAEKKAEEIRVLIKNTEVPLSDRILHVTASIGITLTKPEDTVETLIDRADQLMYESKKNGKDRVTKG